MNDAADKSWLRHAPALNQQIGPLVPWLLALIGAAVLIAGPAQWWFTAVGERDARVRAIAERQALIAHCQRELGRDARALVDQKSGAVICAAGSQRVAPLAHPLKGY